LCQASLSEQSRANCADRFGNPKLLTSLKIVTLTTFVAAMFGWHRIVVVIVANYGVIGPGSPVLRFMARLNPSRQLTHCFQRLANLDNGVFERLGRYESALWRQMLRTLFALQSARRR
jgi:hypothetical protein